MSPTRLAAPLRALLRSFGRAAATGGRAEMLSAAGASVATGRNAAGSLAAETLPAESLAARLPPLLVDAERVAAAVAGGVHGRLRAGPGDSFWQYRPLSPGESAARIDWRQSARGDRLFVRETEWEAAQTVCLWRDRSPSMAWRSGTGGPSKRARAELVLLALGIGLLRGGEHLSLLDDAGRRERFNGRGATEPLARALLADKETPGPSLPGRHDLPRHARLVLAGDFLSPPADMRALLSELAAVPVSPVLVQVLDPAELSLPYEGHIRFEGTEGEPPLLVEQAGGLREGYEAALAAHQRALATLCAATGTTLLRHHTGQPPETLLLALHDAIAPNRGAGRGTSRGTNRVGSR